jgi:hypothetical protein
MFQISSKFILNDVCDFVVGRRHVVDNGRDRFRVQRLEEFSRTNRWIPGQITLLGREKICLVSILISFLSN